MNFEKNHKIIVIMLLLSAGLFIILIAGWYLFNKKLPEVIENLSAKHETVSKFNQDVRNAEMQKKIMDIESRLSQEEAEYNEAKRQEELKRRQYDILAFENSLATVEKPARDACLAQEKVMAQWKVANATNGEAYEATVFAKEQCDRVKKEIRFIRVPENLPVPVEGLLEEARSDLIAHYTKKVEAFDYLLKFIDDNKASFQHRFNEGIKVSRDFSTNAALNIIEAKKKAGIDLLRGVPVNRDESGKAKCSYTINGVFYSEKNPFVFINEKVYYINDFVCGGKIIKILPNRVVIRFPDADKEHGVGEAFSK